MFFFSKSKYCLAWQCPKLLWLSKYKPELKPYDPSLQARFDEGNVIGDLAMGLLGDFKEVTCYKTDGKLDLNKMKELTEQYINDGVENICEASFDWNGLYCAVDILHKTDNGYAIYEVKSSTHASRVYAADIAYQKYVLEHCGVNITDTYLICINSDYVLGDELDIHGLFKIIDMSAEVNDELQNVPALIKKSEQIYASKEEPVIDIGEHCRNPYDCAFWNYCTRNLTKPNVFDLYRIQFKSALKYYYDGKVSYQDLMYNTNIKSERWLNQMSHELSPRPAYIYKDGIRDFLDTLSFPLYFLDFETMQPVLPEFKGTKPYAQIPFQYSLHYIEYDGGELKHKEFLAESGVDPRRAIAESLCENIPKNVCVTAYNKAFECTRLQELADTFPDLADHLINIKNNIKDLLVPFQSGYYYNRAMGGSFSIKSVLPALFPNDPALDYHNLEGVHNGGEAMTVFPLIKDMPPEEAEQTRRNLLKYCELDTFAMVKVWEKLKEAVDE
ncbi:MAG: DUF2779 domain-containing protein [Acutalibacteraceae bacterium]|nr:DUF2779 domain-containing protein [Acutalibacteraceae bacterium]